MTIQTEGVVLTHRGTDPKSFAERLAFIQVYDYNETMTT